jgi:hypothetical protein
MDDVIQWLLYVKLNKWGLLLSTLATEYVALACIRAANVLGGIPNTFLYNYRQAALPFEDAALPFEDAKFGLHDSVTHFPPVVAAVNTVDGGSTINCPVIVG